MKAEPCPHCHHLYDISARTSGDRCMCAKCGKWFLITFYPAGALLTRCANPLKAKA